MRFRSLLILAVILVATPLVAQTNDVGLWLASVRASKTTTDPGTAITFDRGNGFALSFNHFWADWLSTEVAATALRQDGSLRVDDQTVLDLGRLETTAVTLVAQFHFAHRSRFDPYLGGGVATVGSRDLRSSDLDQAGIGTVKIDRKTGFVANAGLNVGLTPQLSLALDGKYIPLKPSSKASGGDTVKLKLNPLILSAGIRVRF